MQSIDSMRFGSSVEIYVVIELRFWVPSRFFPATHYSGVGVRDSLFAKITTIY